MPRAVLPPVLTALHEEPSVGQAMRAGESRLARIAPTVHRRRQEELEEWKRQEQMKLAKAKEEAISSSQKDEPVQSPARLPPVGKARRGSKGEPGRHTKQRTQARDAGGRAALDTLDGMSAMLRDEMAGRWSTVRTIFVQCDLDGNGTVDRREWCMVLPVALNMVGKITEFEASKLFDYFDHDGNGELDYRELYVMLRAGSTVELDEKLKAGAVAFDREVAQKHKVRKEARTRTACNTLGGLMLGITEEAGNKSRPSAAPPSPRKPVDVLGELGKALASKMGRIVDLFREWDVDGSGEIDKREFCDAMVAIGLRPDWTSNGALFDELDTDKSGTLEYNELVRKLRRAARGAAVRLSPRRR